MGAMQKNMKKLTVLLFLVTTHINAQTLYEQALLYQKTENHTDAITCYKNILQKNNYDLLALFNIGCCYLALGKSQQAIDSFEKILSVNPTLIPVLYNKAYTYKTMGNPEKAITLYKEIIQMDNNYDPAQLALGFAYLINGDFEQGWQQHERYLKKSGKNGDSLRSLLTTKTISGKTILLTPEGGLGDSLQFIRYAERLHLMGAEIITCVQKQLIPLFSLCPYINTVIPPTATIPFHDAQATLMSLPAIFNDTEKTFPCNTPYLQADQKLIEYWKTILSQDIHYKIGLCWQADVQNDVSRLPIARRGCALQYFKALQNIVGVSLYSLQKFDGVEEIAHMSPNFPLRCFDNLDEKSGPFMDTAAILKNLDLIITVDTALAHLAGGLGCKVWLLLPYSTDWRWINNRTDSPWYPTMKIFKQKSPFDWQEIIEEVITELNHLINQINTSI
jgi:tetratricopeptide (TPR) repeat protein